MRSAYRHPLVPILLLAIVLRVASACVPMFAHPDEIYQYLEPAHRLLTGQGVITWEWRLGMRSWLLPMLLALPMAVGRALSPDSDLYLLLPRIAMALASLSIVGSAWVLGARVSRLHAVTAALATATWFELIYFAGRTLSEPLATAAFLPAAAILTAKRPGQGALALAGLLMGVTALLRPHYAPACATLIVVASGRALPARWPVLIGGLTALAIGALVDLSAGAAPFHWIVENLHQNIGERRAAAYGLAPPLAYIGWLETMWRWWMIPLAVAIYRGYRQAPALFWAAFVNLAVHSLIGHKEYRFIFLTTAALLVIAALGTADLVSVGMRRWPHLPRAILPVAACALWVAASLTLNGGARMQAMWREGRTGSEAFAILRRDPGVCGVALVEPTTFADVPGSVGLSRGVPISIFMRHDPAFDHVGRRAALERARAGFNRIVAPGRLWFAMPRGYATQHCLSSADGPICLYARPGGCVAARTSPYRINPTLVRLRM